MSIRSGAELRMPPLLLAALLAGAMAGIDRFWPAMRFPFIQSAIAGALVALAGVIICGLGIWRFRRAKTTVNPFKPETSSSLVTGGIYGVSRNPMYLGFLFLLAGWALFLGNAAAWIGPVALVPILDRLQIKPEERMLEEIFGDRYRAYAERARRWI